MIEPVTINIIDFHFSTSSLQGPIDSLLRKSSGCRTFQSPGYSSNERTLLDRSFSWHIGSFKMRPYRRGGTRFSPSRSNEGMEPKEDNFTALTNQGLDYKGESLLVKWEEIRVGIPQKISV